MSFDKLERKAVYRSSTTENVNIFKDIGRLVKRLIKKKKSGDGTKVK